ncbi:hypothetical protein KQX54_010037 [Cotesia glomerata]|uniref:Uncharacterized protein n=1 Tax=Cotesia glomerata TaxID=32391 RepID=A0AAV7I282_COTGL|nr:hypothetical protein KQX54_010037 [Cotesia glomerata]
MYLRCRVEKEEISAARDAAEFGGDETTWGPYPVKPSAFTKRSGSRMPVQDETSVRYTHTELSGPSARVGSEFSERPARLLNPDDATRCLSLGSQLTVEHPGDPSWILNAGVLAIVLVTLFGPLHDPKTRF